RSRARHRIRRLVRRYRAHQPRPSYAERGCSPVGDGGRRLDDADGSPMSRAPCTSLTLTIRTARTPWEIADAAALYERSGTAAFTWRPPGYFQSADFRRFAEEED